MTMFNLERFVKAQEKIYDTVVLELRAELKRTHWMWYIFPQIKGLGKSEKTMCYAISGREEASEYMKHDVLSKRLLECSDIVLSAKKVEITEIFEEVDALKLKSSMTLFELVTAHSVFANVLDKYYGGDRDDNTLQIIRAIERRYNG